MKKLVAVAAFGLVISSPAFAQSFDPDLGSGNIASSPEGYVPGVDRGYGGAYARVVPGGPAPRWDTPVYDQYGNYIGESDPAVRHRLRR